ncbi:ATP-binding protein [Wenjunlia tyrosinilytica]|uniref:NTPase n=1 Tax=Wenjunlia tyrosinilytica TaxID=1544741 RepID=A0A917ZW41_9ACTN|nr:NB-ARC domain-containing protein [Wenjunlia tyrosinilytica]GGO95094.1 NTPase [Wenjunlia tyrosinilytica]
MSGAHNDVSGTVEGPSIQAGAVYGGIRIGGADADGGPRSPWQLPPRVRMADRAAELELLERFRTRAMEEDGRTLVAVSGLGGVGKTVLSLAWLHRLRPHFPDGQLYADLGAESTGGPVGPAEVLGRFLRGLGVTPERIPQAVDERLALYRSLTAQRRLVVLLDDALTAAQVRPLLPSGRSVTAVTSRWRLPGLSVDGCCPVHLEPLDTEAAVELLASTLDDDRVDNEPDQARTLVDLCARLPLAVRVAGARLAARPRRPLTTMVRALTEERGRLAALAIEGDHNVRATLDLSYQELPEAARRLYRLLGLYPGPTFGSGVAAAVLGGSAQTQGDASTVLDLLLDANLISDVGGERFRFHELVRLHAAARAEEDETAEVREAAVRRVFDHLLASATNAEAAIDPHHRSLPRTLGPEPVEAEEFGEDGVGALEWLEEELANLMAVVRRARHLGLPTVTWQLVDAMWPLFTRHKHYDFWRTAHEEGLAAARECDDLAAQCRMLTSGGLGELDMARHTRALEMFEQAALLFRQQGDRLGHARTHNYRGLAHQGLGQLDEAVGAFELAAAECPRWNDPRAGGLARLNLADVAVSRGRLEDAADHADTARRILLEHGDPYNAARAATLLGRADLGRGRLDSAGVHLESALATFRRMTAGFETARALEGLAELAQRREKLQLARERYREALELYTALGVPAAEAARERLEQLQGPPTG